MPSRPYSPRMMASRRLVFPYPFLAPIRTTFLFLVGTGNSNVALAYAFQSRRRIELRNILSLPGFQKRPSRTWGRAIGQIAPEAHASVACRFVQSLLPPDL